MTRVFHPALSGPEQSRYQITDVASVSRSGLCINESPIRDRCGRTMGDLRLSVIDQCNLRCRYCMPEAEYAWLPRADLLSVDEISLIVDAFIAVGVDKIRLTGGEPLIRSDLAAIIEVISAKVGDGSGLQDLAITTNGVLLADQARKLKSAGMRRITISLDTLRPDRFKAISQRGTHYKVIEGIEAVAAAGFTDTKLDSVVIRGFNDDELSDLIEFARNVNAEVRFIEYMDVGGATQWSMDKVFTKAQMLSTLGKKYGPIAALPKYDSAPANRYRLPDGTTFGIIASTTEPFCATCDRSRLTADGIWLHCLYALSGINLRESVRAGASANDVVDSAAWLAGPREPWGRTTLGPTNATGLSSGVPLETRPTSGDAHQRRIIPAGLVPMPACAHSLGDQVRHPPSIQPSPGGNHGTRQRQSM